MAVHCARCGEELMGAVNRCWKCGHTVASHSGPLDLPPIRRAPVQLRPSEPLEAVILDEAESGVQSPLRRGSPFRAGAAGRPLPVTASSPPATGSPVSANFGGAQIAAYASLHLAVLALVFIFSIPIATLLLALAAIPLGIWGLYGSRRRTASIALVLACIALAWGAFASLVQLYELIYGVHPFA